MNPVAILLLLASSVSAQQLVYSTYLKQSFWPSAITADAAGCIYLAGGTGPFEQSPNRHAFIARLTPDAASFAYTRDLGPAFGASAIAVDSAGNAFVAGTTLSSSSPPGSVGFLVKVDPQGNIVFSEQIVGSTSVPAIALTPAGEIIVSGVSGPGFQPSPGAYSVSNTTNRPFLLKLDASGTNVIFCATGIGGSSIAFDSSGNIYVAGTTGFLDYPTTPGAYQTTFPQTFQGSLTGQIGFPGANQYVTKVDPGASTLLYSTGVNNGQSTANAGLAVDASGSAYVTATVGQSWQPTPSLTKLDPLGRSALFSVLVGGAGVALDSAGNVYAGGESYAAVLGGPAQNYPLEPGPVPAGFSNLPTQCLPNNLAGSVSATVTMLSAADGTIESTQWIDGSLVIGGAVMYVNGKLWITGITGTTDVPVTQGALSPDSLLVTATGGNNSGAYLGAVDFTFRGPQVACVLDAASLFHVGSIAPKQLLALFGSNLGDASVSFDGAPAEVLYASSTQINVVVPANVQDRTSAQVTANGISGVPREFWVSSSNPSLFTQLVQYPNPFRGGPSTPVVVARNEDGSFNSSLNPAKSGSNVSLYLNGTGATGPSGISAQVGGANADVVNSVAESDSVWRVDIRLPATFSFPSYQGSLARVGLQIDGVPALPGLYTASLWVSP